MSLKQDRQTKHLASSYAGLALTLILILFAAAPNSRGQATNGSATCSGSIPLAYSYNPYTLDSEATVNSSFPSQNYGTDPIAQVGNEDTIGTLDGANETAAAVHFSVASLPTSLSQAFLNVPLRHSSVNDIVDPNAVFTLTANRLAGPYTENTITWQNQPTTDSTSTYLSTQTIGAGLITATNDTTVSLDITKYIQDVQSGTIANNGLLLTAIVRDNVGNGVPFTAQFNAITSNGHAPYPYITFIENQPSNYLTPQPTSCPGLTTPTPGLTTPTPGLTTPTPGLITPTPNPILSTPTPAPILTTPAPILTTPTPFSATPSFGGLSTPSIFSF